MDSDALSWRAEEACMNAWPSPRQAVLDGWLLRAAGGAIRRVNSVNPLRGARRDPRAVIPAAEAVYRALGQDCLFRVPSLVDGLEEILEGAGYTAEGATLTLHCDLSAVQSPPTAAEIAERPDAEWLAARARLNGVDAAEQRRYEAMLGAILPPKACAATREEGEIAALAYAVIADGLAVIESVVTDPDKRRRGLGRQTVGGLLHWAKASGAGGACLQVVADNAPALALYRSLGFGRELHRYHYRRKPLANQAAGS